MKANWRTEHPSFLLNEFLELKHGRQLPCLQLRGNNEPALHGGSCLDNHLQTQQFPPVTLLGGSDFSSQNGRFLRSVAALARNPQDVIYPI